MFVQLTPGNFSPARWLFVRFSRFRVGGVPCRRRNPSTATCKTSSIFYTATCDLWRCIKAPTSFCKNCTATCKIDIYKLPGNYTGRVKPCRALDRAGGREQRHQVGPGQREARTNTPPNWTREEVRTAKPGHGRQQEQYHQAGQDAEHAGRCIYTRVCARIKTRTRA